LVIFVGWPGGGGFTRASLRAETLTVATYNIENYTAADRMTEAGYRQNYPKPEAAKQALRSVLRALNADVLVLQEMGPRPYLEELRRDLRAEGLDYPYASLLEAADDARHVAVLAKRPFKSATPHTELDFKYFDGRERVKRGVLEVVLPTGAGDVTLWAVHLKSRFTDRPDDPNSAIRRAGEAGAIRDFILKRHPDPQTARLPCWAISTTSKPAGRSALSSSAARRRSRSLLPAADSRGEAWTRAYAKEDSYERPDFILVSPGLKPFVRDGAAKIFDRPETRAASDHRPAGDGQQFGWSDFNRENGKPLFNGSSFLCCSGTFQWRMIGDPDQRGEVGFDGAEAGARAGGVAGGDVPKKIDRITAETAAAVFRSEGAGQVRRERRHALRGLHGGRLPHRVGQLRRSCRHTASRAVCPARAMAS
jgi:hypothetical protein